jgi:hypothetical protein
MEVFVKNQTSWKPGQSGNPHGRPKKGESRKERAAAYIKMIEEYGIPTDEAAEALLAIMAQPALNALTR